MSLLVDVGVKMSLFIYNSKCGSKNELISTCGRKISLLVNVGVNVCI